MCELDVVISQSHTDIVSLVIIKICCFKYFMRASIGCGSWATCLYAPYDSMPYHDITWQASSKFSSIFASKHGETKLELDRIEPLRTQSMVGWKVIQREDGMVDILFNYYIKVSIAIFYWIWDGQMVDPLLY